MVHCAWRAVSVCHEVLTFRTVLNISVGVKVVLSYVESADCRRLCYRLGLIGRLILDHTRFNWVRGISMAWLTSLSPALLTIFHGRQHLGNSACMSDGFGVVVVDDVLSCASFYAYVHSQTPPRQS